MAKSKDFRLQTTTVDTPSAGVISVYANSSGELKFVNSAGTVYSVGGLYTSSRKSDTVSATGNMILNTGSAGGLTVHVYGSTGTYISSQGFPTVLGEPSLWAPIMISGSKYSVPLYTRSA